METAITKESRHDLYDDVAELIYLFSATKKHLHTFLKDLEKQKKHIVSVALLQKQTEYYIAIYKKIGNELDQILQNFHKEKLENVIEKKQKYADLYRSLQSMVAGLITSTDWQSPTFAHALSPLAGRQEGKIIPNYNDYKRDQHLDAKRYAHQFRREYINGLFPFTIPTYVTNSGMAAVTTIINFLQMYKNGEGPVLLGASSYFQNKELIKKLFPDVTQVHEHDTEKIIQLIKKKKPRILFFDSLCNSHDIAVPNLQAVVAALKTIQQETYLVLDNTCLGPSFQPLKLLGKFPKQIHIIVFESLNKYHQYGIDKATGGIIYTYGKDMTELFFAIQHSGTIITDFSSYLLPPPNKTILTKRLQRYERNTAVITTALETTIYTKKQYPLTGIVYPLLPTHPSHAWTKDFSFHGSFFTFSWQKKYDNSKIYKKFIKIVLQEAKKNHVNIVQGTSFGMGTSRIYLTASNTQFGKPFVRFSPGTESRYEIEKITQVLITALEKL